MLNDSEVFDLMETATAAALVMDRQDASVFDFLAEATAGGIVPHRELAELRTEEAERLREWMRGSAQIARHSGDTEWLSGQVLIRTCEVRGAMERGHYGVAILRTRQAECAAAMLAKLLAGLEETASRSAVLVPAWERIEGWR